MKHFLQNFFSKALIVAITFIVLSCGGGSPEETVKEFLKSIDNFEYDKAQACITPQYQQSLDNIKKASADWSEIKKQEYKKKPKPYNILLKEKTDSTASVFVSSASEDGMSMGMMFLLKKKAGRWLIDKTEE